MFIHNLKYSLKTLFKSKMLLFWTFAFPILMGLFFNLAFSDIEKKEMLDTIDIAIIDNEDFDQNIIYKEAFNSLSSDENKMFNINYTTLEESKKLLEEEKISGYILFNGDKTTITVNNSGINETIIRNVVDEINSNKEMITNLINIEIEKAYQNGSIPNTNDITKEVTNLVMTNTAQLNDISNKNLSYTMIEYYTLIAMACLYGGLVSMFITNYKLPNMNSVGKRTSISSIHKGSLLVSSLLASLLIQLIGILLLFIFTLFVIKVDYGSNLLLVILLACAGSLAGLSLGVAISTLFKTNENAKIGILIAVVMSFCLLSGMMGITLKYVIDKNVPILNMINPASMITDGLYALYYYGKTDRYIFDLISLLIFSLIMIILSYRGLRRKKYDSI